MIDEKLRLEEKDEKHVEAIPITPVIGESIKEKLTSAQLTALDEQVKLKGGPAHALAPIANAGTLGLVRRIQKE